MARPPKPTAILEQSGAFDHDPQRRAAREDEPVPTGPLVDPPDRFTLLQREAWHELARLAAPGVLTICDRVLVEMYCELVARMRGERDEEGALRPLKAAERTQLLTILGRMGMTPSDRSRIKAPTPEKQTSDDTFARLASTGRRAKPPVEQ
jgi:phage terminase small subunit